MSQKVQCENTGFRTLYHNDNQCSEKRRINLPESHRGEHLLCIGWIVRLLDLSYHNKTINLLE